MMPVELRVVRAPRRSTGNLEHRVILIPERLPRLRIGPRAFPGEWLVLRPDAEGERERSHFIAWDR